MPRALYVTADGLLEAIGFGQVARVVEGLAAHGWQYEVLSLEKPADLERTDRVHHVRARLAAAGVTWRPLAYDWSQTGAAALHNIASLTRETVRLVKREDIDVVHARAYHGGLAAHAAWLATRTPFLFDTRSYWIDERIEEGRWFTTPLRLSVARGLEHQLFASSAGVVCLTELQADDVRRGRFGDAHGKPIRCIPTCADYDDFVRKPLRALTRVPMELRQRFAGKLVVGIVGSLNRSYLIDETLQLCRAVQQRSANAHVLVLSAQREAYEKAAAAQGLDLARLTVVKADHDAMPEWLSLIDWGLLLLQPNSPAKRASMPTKLAEFFACGVRPVAFGCNSEVTGWVTRAGSGLTLDAVDGASLERAAAAIVAASTDDAVIARARELTAPHFSLRSGIERYAKTLNELLDR